MTSFKTIFKILSSINEFIFDVYFMSHKLRKPQKYFLNGRVIKREEGKGLAIKEFNFAAI